MKQYVVDAFTDKVFAGNPAAVCVMKKWLPDDVMRKIAAENNLSETAFVVKEGALYHLRWFTPKMEIELCGHATLATSYIITRFIEPDAEKVSFRTLSGILTVERKGDLLTMNFPSFSLRPVSVTEKMTAALGIRPIEAYRGADLVCVLQDAAQVRAVVPDQEVILGMEAPLLHITARGEKFDCETRSFAPKHGVAEDPVYGRGHCHVVPLWAEKLNKTELTAYQASSRGGVLYCRYAGERTFLSGRAALYSEAEIFINPD